jgi:hypothetical protein
MASTTIRDAERLRIHVILGVRRIRIASYFNCNDARRGHTLGNWANADEVATQASLP